MSSATAGKAPYRPEAGTRPPRSDGGGNRPEKKNSIQPRSAPLGVVEKSATGKFLRFVTIEIEPSRHRFAVMAFGCHEKENDQYHNTDPEKNKHPFHGQKLTGSWPLVILISRPWETRILSKITYAHLFAFYFSL
ncbi:hypothetical protein [Solidesulfovibrio carbinoliphilus]|uniref:hypothetical protein n=1 Tax=Solidesulfovibrio carbinoliphilus TaxID=345370 RepID=UPI0018DED5D2|nr:hypothetical protein [Solidesulfovibrio carbinoliphilus]